jgi:ergothioneine biosynthesis protein EgtB
MLMLSADDVGVLERYRRVRGLTDELARSLSDADASAQSMADASPAKWHLAHTTWFFETFVLRDHLPGYSLFDARWPLLFNSYYEHEGPRIARAIRGLMTRPSLGDVCTYRNKIDVAIEAAFDDLPDEARALIELGCHHEEQHQELMLTDLLHLFAQNPLAPAVFPPSPLDAGAPAARMGWIAGKSGPVQIGHCSGGFGFDCKGPRHTTWLHPHLLADRLVTNSEWAEFVADGGYDDARHWLSDGWAWVRAHGIEVPAYWARGGTSWSRQFGLDGLRPMNPSAPVCHISYYEADAFARWAGARLPTEAEWECTAQRLNPLEGNFLDRAEAARPVAATSGHGLRQMFGDAWEWTGSAYLGHPGFRAAEGAVGEYNGKFMSGQFVLKGGSCVTPRGHARASYRNFFYPHQRWQFTGLRLARDI